MNDSFLELIDNLTFIILRLYVLTLQVMLIVGVAAFAFPLFAVFFTLYIIYVPVREVWRFLFHGRIQGSLL